MSVQVSSQAILRQLENLQINMAQLESTLLNFEQEEQILSYEAGQFHHKLHERLEIELTAFEIQATELPEIQPIFTIYQEALTEQIRTIGSLFSRIKIAPQSEKELKAARSAAKALEEQLPIKDRILKLQKKVKALEASINRGDVTDPSYLQIDEHMTYIDHFRLSADLLSKKISHNSSLKQPLKDIYTRLKLMQKWYDEQIAAQKKPVSPIRSSERPHKAARESHPSSNVQLQVHSEETITSIGLLLEELIQILESNRDEDIELNLACLFSIDPKFQSKIYSHLYQIHNANKNIKKSHPQYGRVVFQGDKSLCKNPSTFQQDRIEAVRRTLNELPKKHETIAPQLHVDALPVSVDILPPLEVAKSVVQSSSTALEQERVLEAQRVLEQQRVLDEQRALEALIPIPRRIQNLARDVQELDRRIKNAEGHGLPPQEFIAELTIAIHQYREKAQMLAREIPETTIFGGINGDTIKVLERLNAWLEETGEKIKAEQQKAVVAHQEEGVATTPHLLLEKLIATLQSDRKEAVNGHLVALRSLDLKAEKSIYSHLYQIHHAAKNIKKSHPQYGRVVFQGDASLCKNPSHLQQDRIEAVRRTLKELPKQ